MKIHVQKMQLRHSSVSYPLYDELSLNAKTPPTPWNPKFLPD